MTAPELDRLDVLVLDDNDVNRMLVRRQLEKLAARVTCVDDADAAVATFSAQPFDVVLLDCRLQRSDGFEVARRMRALEAERGVPRRTPIVALTAGTEPHLRDRAEAAGMDDLVHKPASLGDLRTVLLRWTGGTADEGYPVDLTWVDNLYDEIGNPGAVRALVETYLRQLPLRTAGLRAALRRADAVAVSALAQELRASGESIGTVRLTRLCQDLERAAGGGLRSDAQPAIDRLEEASAATEAALCTVLARDEGTGS